jgi:DNA-binding XRE family transcriptional regulator
MDRDIITTPGGERLVLVPEAEYVRLVEAHETIEDVAAFDRAKRKLKSGEEELVPSAVVKRLLAGDNPIRVWRRHRGVSVKALAEKTGLAQPYISQVETGRRDGTVATLRKVAKALGVTIDDLVG